MARALRIEFPGALYHVMSRGVNGCPTFLDDWDRRRFLQRVGSFVQRHLLLVHAFCLMSNHFHLLCETPFAGLARWMQGILGPYSQRFHFRHGRVGPLWQGRYRALLVEDGSYFLNSSSYIYRNAPDAGLCTTPEEYPWSSWGAFSGGECPVDWVTTERTLRPFCGPDDYRRFVRGRLGSSAPDPLAEALAGLAYGGEAFVRSILRLVKDRPPDPEIPALTALRRAEEQPSAEQIKSLVDELFPDHSRCFQRRIWVYALSYPTHLTGKQIGLLTELTPSGVTMARQAVASRLQEDLHLVRGIESLRKRLEGLGFRPLHALPQGRAIRKDRDLLPE